MFGNIIFVPNLAVQYLIKVKSREPISLDFYASFYWNPKP